jgi:hypothetical protein
MLRIHDFVSRASEARPGIPRPDLRPLGPHNGVPATQASRGAPRGDKQRELVRGAKARALRFIFRNVLV